MQESLEAQEAFVTAALQDLFGRVFLLFQDTSASDKGVASLVAQLRGPLRRLHVLMQQRVALIFATFVKMCANLTSRLIFFSSISTMLDSLAKSSSEISQSFGSEANGDYALEQSFLLNLCLPINESAALNRALLATDEPSLVAADADLMKFALLYLEVFGAVCKMLTKRDLFAEADPHLSSTATLPLPFPTDLAPAASEWVRGLRHESLTMSLRCLVEEKMSETPPEKKEAFRLRLLRLGRHVELKGIHKLTGLLSEKISPQGTPGITLDSWKQIASTRIRAASQTLLSHVMWEVAESEVAKLETTFLHGRFWAGDRVPIKVSQAAVEFLQSTANWDRRLARILGDLKRAPPTDAYQRHRHLVQRSAAESEVYRLLARKVAVLAPVAFNRSSATAAILRAVLKAWLELIRRSCLSKSGLKQLQVDTKFVTGALSVLLADPEDSAVLEGLISEMLSSGLSRCYEVPRLPKGATSVFNSSDKLDAAYASQLLLTNDEAVRIAEQTKISVLKDPMETDKQKQ